MEFSFGTKRWMQREWKEKEEVVVKEEANEVDRYALGLHAPGFFDKVLHVEKCFLQSEPADKVMNWLYTMYLVFFIPKLMMF
jgi:hypothetical protein